MVSAVGQALEQESLSLKSGDILVIASKVLAYSQGRLAKAKSDEAFRELIKKEADQVLEEGDMVLTMKNKVLIPNAGIDRSNVPEGQAVLWPSEPFKSAEKIRKELMGKFGLDRLGIVISDSHCQPLRMGTSGIAIGWAGFEGVYDARGSKDLFGREMVYTKVATADNLASAANLEMGETDAGVPFVLVRGAKVSFTDTPATADDYFISPDECLYRSLYNFK
ncbi:coenzyme F420-0:L-glutamate ligase [Candidatus Peregrinibacteria bacterium]|nr:coenzyme F420-0:L-glutamate ligase [Candidatus Peregrinibacteria bacterium]